jgi:transcription-repair coupling factor (superfamily II helicase)
LESWQAALDLPRGRPGVVQLALTQGFRLDGRSVLAAPASVKAERNADAAERLLAHLRIGDLVVEPDHGLARLTGLTIEEQVGTREYIALGFLAGAQQLIPAEDVGSIWRYGAVSSISPGRLDSSAWLERRRQVEQEIAAAAHALVQRLRARENARAAIIETGPDYQRFVRRVPFALSRGQADAIRAVLYDMRRGRPMHRLICGDVGFGKTEVALHAAAAAVFAGKQVAVAAPTTLLARQHLETFRRRLPGVRVEPLIRSSRSAESRQVLAAAKGGEAKVLVGTHAVAAARFHDLGLVIIDEEQRFGEAQKRRLRSLGPEAHTVVMTATPLPRSLQTTLVGLIDASVLGDPPAGRQPVRGFVVPFDATVIRAALMREARRGGQSFVVCPRIEDIAPLEVRLRDQVPELSVAVAHGRIRGDALDRVMLEFVNGNHDVLLATSIVEAGLDVPNANTMIVCQADRFGLAQLHQLRGRVGRGRVRASAYFITDPERKIPAGARKRLQAIARLDALGAGFAVSAADLDQRGAGDLLGDEQSGHVRLIGTELYRHVLARELARARGNAPDDEWTPEITLDVPAYVPRDLVPEADLRLEIYRRLARLESDQKVEEAADELEDRFGDLPPPLLALLGLVRLRVLCRALGIASVSAGPEAVALGPRGRKLALRCSGARVKGERVILPIAEVEPRRRLHRILALLREERDFHVGGR